MDFEWSVYLRRLVLGVTIKCLKSQPGTLKQPLTGFRCNYELR